MLSSMISHSSPSSRLCGSSMGASHESATREITGGSAEDRGQSGHRGVPDGSAAHPRSRSSDPTCQNPPRPTTASILGQLSHAAAETPVLEAEACDRPGQQEVHVPATADNADG